MHESSTGQTAWWWCPGRTPRSTLIYICIQPSIVDCYFLLLTSAPSRRTWTPVVQKGHITSCVVELRSGSGSPADCRPRWQLSWRQSPESARSAGHGAVCLTANDLQESGKCDVPDRALTRCYLTLWLWDGYCDAASADAAANAASAAFAFAAFAEKQLLDLATALTSTGC